MEYIIVWRSNHRGPFIDGEENGGGFKTTFSSYEEAKAEADRVVEQEGPQSPWYFDYEIFESSNG